MILNLIELLLNIGLLFNSKKAQEKKALLPIMLLVVLILVTIVFLIYMSNKTSASTNIVFSNFKSRWD